MGGLREEVQGQARRYSKALEELQRRGEREEQLEIELQNSKNLRNILEKDQLRLLRVLDSQSGKELEGRIEK